MKAKFYNISLWLSVLLVSLAFIYHFVGCSNKMLYDEQLLFFVLAVLISFTSLFLLKRRPNFQAVLQLAASIIIFGLFLRCLISLITSWSKSLIVLAIFIGAIAFEFLVFLSLGQFTNLVVGKTGRVIAALILLIFIPASSLTLLFPMALIKYSSFTNDFISTGFLGTLLFIPIVSFLGNKWQLPSLTPNFSSYLKVSNIIFFTIICILFILWSRYHAGTNIWDSLFQYNDHWAPHYS